ncbi:MAG: DUF1800 family protein [Bacteroidota bacterium]
MRDSLTATAVAPLPVYSGPWTKRTAAHLLRRSTFGPRLAEINKLHDLGLQDAVDFILRPHSPPPPPLNHIPDADPNIPVGTTWVDKPYRTDSRFRTQSFTGWYFEHLLRSEAGIRDKMAFFWINHFGISGTRDHRGLYKYINLFQEIGPGSFQDMLERITVDPSMLEFLDGRDNFASNPNENYAREFLELFTIQKNAEGETCYTEEDVKEFARIFTGWRPYPFHFSPDEDIPIDSYFDPESHDTGTKRLSDCFNGIFIRNLGANEYKFAISVVLTKREVAQALCRKLYRFFVFYDITPKVEASVITPLADILYDNLYEIRPVLKALFCSQHFYDMAVRGPMIKNPYEFVGSILRPFYYYDHLNPDLRKTYQIGSLINNLTEELDITFISPPTVAGWKAYYDVPRFYRNWISPTLLQRRSDITERFLSLNNHVNNFLLRLDIRGIVYELSDPLEVDELIREFALLFLPRELHPLQLAGLKESLLQGLPDMEWRRQCAQYLSSPNDQEIVTAVESRLLRFLTALFSMAEFQLQ